jgi:radical SAM protein with 4Fe4S-binding SPASM domain
MVTAKANQNFHTIAGESVVRGSSPAFLEYRRQWEARPETFTPGSFPLHLDIEASCLCNLRCTFCATNFEPIGGKGFMSMDTFRKAIDEGAKSGLCAIKLNSGGRGEPLLNSSAAEMVKYAKQKGIMDVYFNTNAMLLTEDIARRLIDAGLDRISVSFEGTTADVYEKYRRGASYETVMKNIKGLIRLKKEMGRERPFVRVQTVALPELKPHLDEYREFWGRIVDEVAFIDFKDYGHLKHGLDYQWACPYLWQRMMIRWDGTISLCQFDYTSFFDFGNVNSGTTIRQAWDSELMRSIRKLHEHGKSGEMKLCNGCAFRTTEIMKQQEKS